MEKKYFKPGIFIDNGSANVRSLVREMENHPLGGEHLGHIVLMEKCEHFEKGWHAIIDKNKIEYKSGPHSTPEFAFEALLNFVRELDPSSKEWLPE